MISLTPLLELLATKPVGFDGDWFRQVQGASEYAQIKMDAFPLPCLWLIRVSDKSEHAGERSENVGVNFDVVIAVSNIRSHRPGDTDDMVLAYRLAVKTLLLGYQYNHSQPIKFGGGQVLQYADGDIFWRDKYTFESLIDNYLPDPAPYAGLNYTGSTL